MNKLYIYMDKKGIKYEVVNFGGSYFHDNTVNVTVQGASVVFDYMLHDPKKLINQEHILKQYCNRYGYIIIKEGNSYYPVRVYWIVSASDHDRLEHYYFYQSRSVSECEKYIHEAKRAGVPDLEINEGCKKIMAAWEHEYKDFLRNIKRLEA